MMHLIMQTFAVCTTAYENAALCGVWWFEAPAISLVGQPTLIMTELSYGNGILTDEDDSKIKSLFLLWKEKATPFDFWNREWMWKLAVKALYRWIEESIATSSVR